MKKLLASSCLLLSISFGANIMPYGAYLQYTDSKKDIGYVGGVYADYITSPYKLEFDVETTSINYIDTTPNYTKDDITFIGNYYRTPMYRYRLGIHNIFVTQKGNKQYNQVFFGGFLYNQKHSYKLGIDFYISNYETFNVYQVTPKIGYSFGENYMPMGSFYIEAKFNYIKISNKGYAPKQDYRNYDVKFVNYVGPWSVDFEVSYNRFAYKVASNGFMVYDMGDEYTRLYIAKLRYSFDKFNSMEVSFNRGFFNENGVEADSKVYLASFVTKF